MSEGNGMEETTPLHKYCPLCATPLVERFVHDTNRFACPECSYILFPAPKLVAVVTVMYHGKVLLGRRNIGPCLGEWSFVSGYIDRGEKVEEAAIREVKEETNLDVQLERLIGIFSSRGNPYVILAFQASIVNDDLTALTAQPDEVSELAFFALDEMPPLAFPTDSAILQALCHVRPNGTV
jgi:8-oxo-dGTP diphosphatase